MLQLTDTLERREHIVHLTHIVRLAERILETEIVGLPLIIAAVLEKQQLQPAAQHTAEVGSLRHENHADTKPKLRELRLRHLRDRMFRGDVTDFMSENR